MADDDPLNGNGASAEERAEAGEEIEELLPMGALDGEGPTLQNIVKRGMPVTLKVALSRAEVPNQGGGLFDPGRYGRALVTFIPGAHHPLPLREDANNPEKVTAWKVTQDLRVTHVAPATNPYALIRAEYEALLATEPEKAGGLLDELQRMAAEALAAA